MEFNSPRRPAPRARRAAALAAVLVLVLAAAPALAQAEKGIAIAEAPEAGYFTCFGENAVDTMECARDRCEAEGGDPCYRIRWCYPAGWSGSMRFVAEGEGSRSTFVCGAPSDEGVKAMLSAWCETSPWASECTLVSMWDPLGNEVGAETPLGKNGD